MGQRISKPVTSHEADSPHEENSQKQRQYYPIQPSPVKKDEMDLSLGEAIHKDDETQGQATPGIESDGEPQYEWLLAKLANEQPPPETTAASSSSGELYQREYSIYLEIFKANIAKNGINIIQVEKVFQTPIWSGGNIIFLNYNSSSSSSMVSTHDTTHDTTHETAHGTAQNATQGTPEASEPAVYKGFDTEMYFFELNFYYYKYKDWFRCMVDSFWGPQIASVFQIIHNNRPFIQIAFKLSWSFAGEREKYYASVMMFLHIIARLRPLQGLGPLTDIFGFSLVNFSGKVITEFETVERLGVDRPEGEGSQSRKFVVRHPIEAWRSVVVTIKD
ncbi:hypothetical protein F5Y00DRAFT_261072 [Daldinia vernicosa]|uniref:uncharacterized protein n=1 Tax=Daldinia vernicosa TaxID=114800 RepID=UPI0020075EA1|nr:uncharacterized protein F5Y00DRAFT_261072 [Daldinia vernicosa]KAI0849967.1 hypothetical protein F5Y00DRAFT_261072 [Daldinia vernicosa]